MFCFHHGIIRINNSQVRWYLDHGIHHIFLLSSSSSSAFPAIPLGFTNLGEIFAYVTVFHLTIEVVTFRFHAWCMLSVFLLLAFTHLGHEYQDLFVHAMECMCAQTKPWFILSSERVLGEWSQNPC